MRTDLQQQPDATPARRQPAGPRRSGLEWIPRPTSPSIRANAKSIDPVSRPQSRPALSISITASDVNSAIFTFSMIDGGGSVIADVIAPMVRTRPLPAVSYDQHIELFHVGDPALGGWQDETRPLPSVERRGSIDPKSLTLRRTPRGVWICSLQRWLGHAEAAPRHV